MIRHLSFALVALVATAVLAACAGGMNSAVPGIPASLQNAARPDRHRTGRATFKIHIPPCRRAHDRCRRRAHFISPATQSLTIAIDGGTAVPYGLTPTSPGCNVYGPVSYLECRISVTITTGPHTFSLVTYDGLNGTGNALSSALNVPFTVVGGSNEGLGVTLGGIARSLAVIPPNTPQVTGSQFDGFTIYGNNTLPFTVLPVDADGNYILGPGAPSVSVNISSNFHLTAGTPPPNAPNVVPLTSTYQPVNPTLAEVVTALAFASPSPGSGAGNASTQVRFALFQPWVYTVYWTSNSVYVTNEAGSARTLSSSSPFSRVPAPSGIAYDPHNFWPYIPSTDGPVCVYDVEGDTVYVSGNWGGTQTPYDIAYVPTSAYGDALYVVNNNAGSYNGGAGPRPRGMRPHVGYYGVTGYTENGNPITSLLSFPGLYSPVSIAYDSHNGDLYVTDDEYGWVSQYDQTGNLISTLQSVTTGGFGGIAFDSHNNTLYVVDAQNSKVIAFTESGQLVKLAAGAFSNLNSPYGITYDPYNGFLYIGNQGNNKVTVYNENGAQQKPLAGFGSSSGVKPWGIAVVP